MYAAGLTMKKDNIPEFMERFERFVSETIKDEQMVPQVQIDTELEFTDITEKFYRVLEQFQPFGPENMAPVFITRNVSDTGKGRTVGSGGEHLKLDLCSESTGTASLPAIAFGQGNKNEVLKDGVPIDICYSIEMNEFKGMRNLQLNIKDIKLSVKK